MALEKDPEMSRRRNNAVTIDPAAAGSPLNARANIFILARVLFAESSLSKANSVVYDKMNFFECFQLFL